ncbi:MAG: hypothetical protein VW986_04430 [Gammaproteobacteria bacterium]
MARSYPIERVKSKAIDQYASLAKVPGPLDPGSSNKRQAATFCRATKLIMNLSVKHQA